MITEEQFRSATYLPDPAVQSLVNLAFKLNKPLLLEGPPGVGKTSLAKAVASILSTTLYRIQCYEGITAESILGEYNYHKQLLALEQHKGEDLDVFDRDYYIARPLLQAIESPDPVVLLIDEIDRSDEEFEAYLLEALGEQQVTIPELGTITANSVPLVVLTSNGTRELSPALRRRALYLYLSYPTPSREAEIIKMHVPQLEDSIIERIIRVVRKLRHADKVSQPPAVAEAIEFARAILLLGESYLSKEGIEQLSGVLVKNSADTAALKAILDELTV